MPQQRKMEAVFSVFNKKPAPRWNKSISRRISALTVWSDGSDVVTRVVPR